jgi:hypothetical protein
MRRNQPKKVEEYIEIRISQLKDDMNKAHDEHDKSWYNRIIQELSWVKDTEHNCYMSKEIGSDATKLRMNKF